MVLSPHLCGARVTNSRLLCVTQRLIEVAYHGCVEEDDAVNKETVAPCIVVTEQLVKKLA